MALFQNSKNQRGGSSSGESGGGATGNNGNITSDVAFDRLLKERSIISSSMRAVNDVLR